MQERQVRTAEIRLIKYDMPEVNIRYTGRSSSMVAADSDAVWQIQREYRIGNITVTTYAQKGEFNCVWNDRVSYFSAATPDPNSPLGGTIAVSGTFTATGLRTGGRYSSVTIDDTSWTALPPVALANRNEIAIQNSSSKNIKVNYDPLEPGYVGTLLTPDAERMYPITDSIVIYAKAAPGAGSIVIAVEELA